MSLADYIAKPEVWIAVLSLGGTLITYFKSRYERQTALRQADLDRADRLTGDDWNRMRAIIDEVRKEATQAKQEADELRQEAETLRERQQQNIQNNWELRVENAELKTRLSACEDEIGKLRQALARFEADG